MKVIQCPYKASKLPVNDSKNFCTSSHTKVFPQISWVPYIKDLAEDMWAAALQPCCIKYCGHKVKVQTNSLYHRLKWSSNKICILQTKFEFRKKTNIPNLKSIITCNEEKTTNSTVSMKTLQKLEYKTENFFKINNRNKHSKQTHISKQRMVVTKKLTVAQKIAWRVCCTSTLLLWILANKSAPEAEQYWAAMRSVIISHRHQQNKNDLEHTQH